MNNELSIIKQALKYESYKEIDNLLDVSVLSKELQGLYRSLSRFHQDHPGNILSVADLANIFPVTKDKEFYSGVFDTLQSLEVHNESVVYLLRSLHEKQLLRKMSMAAYEGSEGNEKSQEVLRSLVESWTKTSKTKEDGVEFEFTSQNIDELLDSAVFSKGLSWRLVSLNRTLGPLRKGDFGFIFARPETGKTTFLASEETAFAEQLEDKDGPILHLNNEEQNDKVQLRMFQASTGCTLEQLYSNRKKVQEEYDRRTKSKILMPVMGSSIHFKQIERLCEKYAPSLVVIDQIDKVLGCDNDREDLRLGAIYQRTRDLAKEFCPFIGVCQADGTGEGQKWLTMGNVANAKTSKQAEADWILGIGKIPDVGYEMLRFFNISKNKLMGSKETDPKQRHHKWEVLIRAEIARYDDIK